MSENQLNRQEISEDQMIRNATWGALLLATAGLLFFGFCVMEATFTDWQDFINVGAPLVLAIISLVSIPFTRNKSVLQGSWIVFIANLIMPVTVSLFLTGIGGAALIYTVVSSSLLIWRVLPRSSWRWAMFIVSITLLMIGIITIIQPSFQAPGEPKLVIFIAGVTAVLFLAFRSRRLWG